MYIHTYIEKEKGVRYFVVTKIQRTFQELERP